MNGMEDIDMVIGVDPGKSGAISVLWGRETDYRKLTETHHDVVRWLREEICVESGNVRCVAALEKVSASPQMGVTSSFTFGRSYGALEMMLTMLGVPFVFVTPQTWQKAMGCLTGGDKNISKAAAQRLFPALKITHANADSLLIAEWCRRNRDKLFAEASK